MTDFVRPVGAALLMSAFALAVAAAHPQRPGRGDVEILVNGAPQQRYAYDGRWYVEALKGREYAIRLRNPYPVRVAVALSVDGLNTIDARHTTAADARKWVLDPYEVVTISGWQTSRTQARRFEFTTEEQSYAQALGRADNLGLISAAFFRERVAAVTRAPAPAPTAPSAPAAESSSRDRSTASARGLSKDEYAATGMGRETDHAVTQVWLDLEDTPAHTVNIRYEYRPQLVRLGILPVARVNDPLQRRERATGFEDGFSPEPPRR